MYSIRRGKFILSIVLILVLCLNVILFSQNIGITGFFVQESSFYDSINREFDENSIFLWSPKDLAEDSYFGISGNASGNGNFRVSLVDDDRIIVIIDEVLDNEKLFFNEYNNYKGLLDLSPGKFLIRVEVDNVDASIDSIYYSNFELGKGVFDKVEMESAYVPENITINYEGRYTILTTEDGFDLIIKNTTIRGLRQSSRVFSDFVDDFEVSSEVFAMESVDIDNATIVLNKTGKVNVIKKCLNFEMEIGLCLSGWIDTKIPFIQDNETITFVVDSFSAYAGGELPSIQWADPVTPDPVTNINSQSGLTSINWTWTDPGNSDFNHTEVWLDNVFMVNTTSAMFDATGLTTNQSYTIQLRAVDNIGNIADWFNDTASTVEGNSVPRVSFVEFDPYQLNSVTDATVLGMYSDSNGDSGSVSFVWFVNGNSVFNNSVNVSTGDSFNDTLALGNFSLNDNVSVQITANDGYVDSIVYEINDTVGAQAPIINSFYLSSNILGLGKQINFNVTVSNGDFVVDSVWIDLSNSQKNVTIPLTDLGNWIGNYISFVPGVNYIDLYVNDTNGNLEHWKKQYSVSGTFNINIEVDKTNYTLNELVEAIGLP